MPTTTTIKRKTETGKHTPRASDGDSPATRSDYSFISDPLVETVEESDATSVASVDSVFLDLEDLIDGDFSATDYVDLGKGYCRFIFQAQGAKQERVCGNTKFCRRHGHRNGHNTKAQAAEGIYLGMPRTRANQTSIDGWLKGLIPTHEYQALQVITKGENEKAAAALTISSPQVTKGYAPYSSGEGLLVSTAETPLRGNLSPEADSKELPSKAGNPPSFTKAQLTDLESKISDRLESKLEAQLADMRTYSSKMLKVMQDQADRFRDLQSQNVKADGIPAAITKDGTTRHNRRWFGVNKGRQAGVYASSKRASKAASKFKGTPSAEVRRFNTEHDAWAWVDGDSETSGSDSNAGGGNPVRKGKGGPGGGGSESSGTDSTSKKPRKRGAIPNTDEDEIKPFDFIHSDKSAGKGDEIFGVELNTEQQMIKELCPSGLSTEQKFDLTECWEDAMGIDGTYGVSEQDRGDEQEDEGTFSRLVDALEAIRTDRGRTSRITRDGRWTQKSRTALNRVKSAVDLIALNEALMSSLRITVKNRHMDMRTVLEPLQWSEDTVAGYLSGAKFTFLCRETYRHYQTLIQHLTGSLNKGGWTRVQSDVVFFGIRLARIRQGARTRFMFLLRTYVFLRDQAHTGFQSPERTSAQATGTSDRLLELEGQLQQLQAPKASAAAGSGTSATSRNCGKCWQKFHPGHAAKCPFKQMTDVQARACGKVVKKKIAEGTEAEQAIREVTAAPPEE
jgi:hypothetical protein